MLKKLIIVFLYFPVLGISGNAYAWEVDKVLFSDDSGTSYTQKGNAVYSNTGVMYTVSGGLISGSDGSRYERAGNTIYKDGEPACYIIRDQIHCEYAD